MATFQIDHIAQTIPAEVLHRHPGENHISRFLFDSRRLMGPEGTMFVALDGHHRNGHDYIPGLYARGVRSFLVSRPVDLPGDANVLLVPDTLDALQRLAAAHRKTLQATFIGITGSNGKTVVKEWLFQAISPRFSISRSPGSYNSQLGVALSVLQAGPYDQLAIIEAGISMPGEMKKLEEMIRPQIGVLTTIGPAHDEHFADREQKIREKLALFRHAETVIFPADLSALDGIIEQELPKRIRRFSWGQGAGDVRLISAARKDEGTSLSIRYREETTEVWIPFTDQASIENIMTTISVMLVTGMDLPSIPPRIASLHSVVMRLEIKEGVRGCSLINDSYSSDLRSLGIALDFLNQQDKGRRKVIILSDILQSGLDGKELYARVSRMLMDMEYERLIGIGAAISSHAGLFNGRKDFFSDTEAFLASGLLSRLNEDIILLKGARPFHFEDIVHRLQRKSHETALQINLNALVHNLKHYQSKLNPGTRTMVMIKALGYGSGSREIAAALEYHQVDYLAVAYADEGVELREAGLRLPIMVMNPDRESLGSLIRAGLEPEIYSFSILEELASLMKRNERPSQEVRIHIKIDTGMHRLGFLPGEVPLLSERLQGIDGIHVRSVFSHLAASEDPGEDPFTHQQVAVFMQAFGQLSTSLGYQPWRHVLNTAGIVRFPDYHFEMVRLGLGLYGVSPLREEQPFLENVSTLRSVISQIKEIPEGDAVGYNRTWRATRPSRIAIIPVGYADGLDMRLGRGRGSILHKGRRLSLIGSICMDMCMVDVTGINAMEGDEVIIFGEGMGVEEVARLAGTIPYEILTGISSRVKRTYFYE